MFRMRLWLLTLSLLALAAPLRAGPPPGVKVLHDVAYGASAAQRYDLYLPEGARGAAVILLVHGGGWKFGDKAHAAVVDNKVAFWARAGLIVMAVNYRMVPEAAPLEQARDVARALAHAQQQAGSWGGDRHRFILMGHSAGAHLVALLASSPELAQGAPFLGTVALDGAGFDIEEIMGRRHMASYDEAFGSKPEDWRAASPYAQLDGPGKPLLAVCSSRRPVACAQAQRYADKARGFGMQVQVLPQHLSHRDINQRLGEAGAYTSAVDAFVRSLLARP
jgi:arylformamidase